MQVILEMRRQSRKDIFFIRVTVYNNTVIRVQSSYFLPLALQTYMISYMYDFMGKPFWVLCCEVCYVST